MSQPTVGSEILNEIERCSELIGLYESLRGPGVYVDFAINSIRRTISDAKEAITGDDPVACIRVLERLRDHK
ncbi:MAG: hypothetical protein JNJ77_19945 [Planctomycetia bacterium]|nr:hypothetical protein [Planctomycetia bacterium]